MASHIGGATGRRVSELPTNTFEAKLVPAVPVADSYFGASLAVGTQSNGQPQVFVGTRGRPADPEAGSAQASVFVRSSNGSWGSEECSPPPLPTRGSRRRSQPKESPSTSACLTRRILDSPHLSNIGYVLDGLPGSPPFAHLVLGGIPPLPKLPPILAEVIDPPDVGQILRSLPRRP